MIKSAKEVERLEKLIGQLNGLHAELSLLAKKSPNDGINPFKMRLVNKILADANMLLGGYTPFDDFSQFSEDSLPTNSDVTLIIVQYMEQIERFRSANVMCDKSYNWVYKVNGAPSDIESSPPTKLGGYRE